MVGEYVPQRTADGKYRVKQCHGSTGYCWCVDPNTGKEVEGSRVAPGHGEPACASNLAMTLVALERKGPCAEESQRLGTEMPGKYVPQCTEAGYYKVEQYYGSTGYSWCVDPETGKELVGSRIAPGHGKPACPPCHKKRAEALQRPGMIGSYAPTCDEYGLFVPTQHHGSTGQSWCVDRFSGEEFENTRTHPGQAAPECSGSRYCRKNQTEGRPCCAMYFAGASSVYRMDCTKNGYFKAEQVFPFNNEHFCVDPSTGLVAPDAKAPNCGACFKYNEDKVGGTCTYAWMRWTPMCRLGGQPLTCDAKTGNYQPLQKSHDLYRWCVNPLTGAIEGEKRRFDDKTPLPCEH